VAFCPKALGIYRERTWGHYAGMVARTAKAFAALGLKAGDRIAVMADACEEWLICDQAAQALGAIVFGIYPTASAEEVEYQMRDGGAELFIAEDQEYVDRIPPLVGRLPALRRIVVIDDTALFAAAMPTSPGWRRRLRSSIPRSRPSSSTPPAPPAIPRAR
jgi:long-chain acyl-CoA synthetase